MVLCCAVLRMVCVCVCVRVCVFTNKCMNACVCCVSVCLIVLNMYVCAYVLTRELCTCLCININPVCTYVCMFVSVYVRAWHGDNTTPVHTYIHTDTNACSSTQTRASFHLRKVIIYNREIFVAETGLTESGVCRQG